MLLLAPWPSLEEDEEDESPSLLIFRPSTGCWMNTHSVFVSLSTFTEDRSISGNTKEEPPPPPSCSASSAVLIRSRGGWCCPLAASCCTTKLVTTRHRRLVYH